MHRIGRRRWSAVLAALMALLVCAGSASAEMRTGHATVHYPSETSASFPGIQRVDVHYDDASGALAVDVALRSALADSSQTSALRSTKIELHLGSAWGNEIISADSCDWSLEPSIQVDFDLGKLQASLYGEVVSAGATPFPLTLSPDRQHVSVSIPSVATPAPNLICLNGDMVGPDGMALDAPQDFLVGALLDGFGATDGEVGAQAQESLLAEFRYLHNAFVKHRGDEILVVPGARARCTPQSGRAYVICTASARMRLIVGQPVISLRGSRYYERRTVNGRHRLQWEQAMRVRVHWAKCPRVINRARAGKPCETRLIFHTGDDLRDIVIARLSKLVKAQR